jgi:hypothetical protein
MKKLTKHQKAEILLIKYDDGKEHRYTDLEVDLLEIPMAEQTMTTIMNRWKKVKRIAFPHRPGYFIVNNTIYRPIHPNQQKLGDV